MSEEWEETPRHYLRLDIRMLLQDIAITEVSTTRCRAPRREKQFSVETSNCFLCSVYFHKWLHEGENAAKSTVTTIRSATHVKLFQVEMEEAVDEPEAEEEKKSEEDEDDFDDGVRRAGLCLLSLLTGAGLSGGSRKMRTGIAVV